MNARDIKQLETVKEILESIHLPPFYTKRTNMETLKDTIRTDTELAGEALKIIEKLLEGYS